MNKQLSRQVFVPKPRYWLKQRPLAILFKTFTLKKKIDKAEKKPYLRPNYKEKDWFRRHLFEIIILGLGLFFIHFFLFSGTFQGENINSTKASEYGSFIGGYLGTLFALASVVFLYTTLRLQRQTSQIEKFENIFFELLNLHKNNVQEIIIKNQNGKKIFVLFIREYREIFKIVKKTFKSIDSSNDLINISYLTFFYGTGPNSTRVLKSYLSKYKNKEVEKLIENLNECKSEVKRTRKFNYTPFEGHQSRLGHYFRHMFQTISFVDKRSIDIEKYEYTKILRAQLSNHEQVLFALNSISDLGKSWNEVDLIKRYRLIKNIPKDFFDSENEFNLKDFFKDLIFEHEEKR